MAIKHMWDVFISHASEDKDFVRPLAISLNQLGADIWYDEFALELGDSLSKSIDRGLANCKYGLIVISPAFIGKGWPDYELRGFISREIGNEKIILPIWHDVTREDVIAFSPHLADKLAFNTSNMSAEEIVIGILKVIRPDIYEKHPRAQLQKIASGDALRELQEELEYTKAQIDVCPHCEAELCSMGDVDVGSDEYQTYEATGKEYACGYSTLDGSLTSPCPADPEYPKIEDFNLETEYKEESKQWVCYPRPKTKIPMMLRWFFV